MSRTAITWPMSMQMQARFGLQTLGCTLVEGCNLHRVRQDAKDSPTFSREDTQLLPVLRSESMQNFVIFGFIVFSTCRVSPANACTAHACSVSNSLHLA